MKKGYIYTALSAIVFGLMPLLTKIIIARGATSLTIPFFRVFYVTIVLFFVLKIKCIVIECILEIISLNLLCKYLQTVVLYLQEE